MCSLPAGCLRRVSVAVVRRRCGRVRWPSAYWSLPPPPSCRPRPSFGRRAYLFVAPDSEAIIVLGAVDGVVAVAGVDGIAEAAQRVAEEGIRLAREIDNVRAAGARDEVFIGDAHRVVLMVGARPNAQVPPPAKHPMPAR